MLRTVTCTRRGSIEQESAARRTWANEGLTHDRMRHNNRSSLCACAEPVLLTHRKTLYNTLAADSSIQMMTQVYIRHVFRPGSVCRYLVAFNLAVLLLAAARRMVCNRVAEVSGQQRTVLLADRMSTVTSSGKDTSPCPSS